MEKINRKKISKLLFFATVSCFGLYEANLLQSCGGGNKNLNLYNTVTGKTIGEIYPSSVNGKLMDPSMVYIEGGAFLCGRYRDRNSCVVTVTPFMVSKAEITNREYNEFIRWCLDNDPNAVKSLLPNFDTDIKSLKLAR
ncbi:MAG: SUMF1/EgtB/PvdO family nonheme iron enzyme, partial [Cytophagales bacterium]|nr:SUMF1/EgtB/PvdO family nonheme iron enzyme [Cytophagales bacterium]